MGKRGWEGRGKESGSLMRGGDRGVGRERWVGGGV